MYFLYILASKESQRHYIGITSNVLRRLKEHNRGEVRSTKSYRPWVLAHQETFENKMFARKREIFLKKNYQAREEIFRKI